MLHAMDGLSLFFMLDMSKDEVAQLINEEDLISLASLVIVADLRLQRKQKKVCVPQDPDDFLLMLKWFVNFLFSVFSKTCPLFLIIKEVIRSL